MREYVHYINWPLRCFYVYQRYVSSTVTDLCKFIQSYTVAVDITSSNKKQKNNYNNNSKYLFIVLLFSVACNMEFILKEDLMSTKTFVLQVIGIMNRGGAEAMIMNLYRNIDRTKVQFDFVENSFERAAFDDEIEY